jgi:hypothetical protein
MMERLRPVATYLVVSIGKAIWGTLARQSRLSRRAAAAAEAARLYRHRGAAAQIGALRRLRSLPFPGTSRVRPPDCHQTRTRLAEGPPRVEPTG